MKKKNNTNESQKSPKSQNMRFSKDPQIQAKLSRMAQEIRETNLSIKRDNLKIGRVLTEASQMLPHGQFHRWAKVECDFSKSTAYNLINLYAVCCGQPDIVKKISPSVLYFIGSKKFPDKLRKHLLKNASILNDISNKAIRDVAKKFAHGELTLDSPEVEALLQQDKQRNHLFRFQSRINKQLTTLKEFNDELKNMATEIEKWNLSPRSKKLKKQRMGRMGSNIKEMIDMLKKESDNIKKYKSNTTRKPKRPSASRTN